MTRWAIITGEYPPQPGGVADYTRQVAAALAAAGDAVTVYAPPGTSLIDPGVVVHRLPDHFGIRGLRALDGALGRHPRPDRILIQYVPHAYGMKAMNLPFAVWVSARAGRIAPVWVMFHEVSVKFRWRPWQYLLLGPTTGAMARLIAGAADRIFVTIPAWADDIHRICPRAKEATCLPVPCNVDTAATPAAVATVRKQYSCGPDTRLLGHFGTYGELTNRLLEPTLSQLLSDFPELRVLLLGRGSAAFRDRFLASHASDSPSLTRRDRVSDHASGTARVHASGELDPTTMAAHLRACDLLLQPYPDGVSARRTSVMAGLANGVPVITNLGFLSEPFWAATEAAVIASGPNPSLLAAAVGTVLEMPGPERGRIGVRAAAWYRECFSLEHTIKALQGSA